MSKRIIATGPSGGKRTFTSAAAVSRALSGTGDTSSRLSMAISRAANAGGGYIGRTFVKFAK